MRIGSSSGMIANASDRPVRIISRTSQLRTMPMRGFTIENDTASRTSFYAKDHIATCSGVFGGLRASSCKARCCHYSFAFTGEHYRIGVDGVTHDPFERLGLTREH